MNLSKRIITWQWGNNAEHNEYTTSRGFIFGNYGESLSHYLNLVEEARKDFPTLTDGDIALSKVTQSTYMKGFSCVSFPLPANTTHPDYTPWDRFDFSY